VERVRWVGGYGRMDTVDAVSYTAAEADPVARAAGAAKAHLNEDHAEALLVMAQALGGYPDATAATCTSIDRYGLDLDLDTPRGPTATRIGFAKRVDAADGLRAATVELAGRARSG
jgi:heme iron utilization protein